MPEPGAPAPPASLAAEGLVVELGDRAVLDGVDLAAPAGATTAVLGPSGGGKTTLLRALAGLVPLAAGRVVVDGVDVGDVPTHRRDLGLMFQDHVLFPHRDVAANVGFGLRMRGVGARDRARRVAEVLELVGLAGFEGRSVVDLSGGEAQRVALARALAPRPRVLLLDEPLTSLDRVLHDRLLGDLRRLFAELGLTVVHVTHDREEALALADHLVVLGGGQVLQAGAPRALWEAPASVEVARFLGLDAIWDVALAHGRALVGGRVVVDGLDGPPPGGDGPARLVVRPDAVAVVGAEAPGALAATVLDVAFVGDRTSVVLAVEPAPSAGAALAPVRALVTGPPPATGERVLVALDPRGCSVLPAHGP